MTSVSMQDIKSKAMVPHYFAVEIKVEKTMDQSVLIQLREEPVEVNTDIEAMFYGRKIQKSFKLSLVGKWLP